MGTTNTDLCLNRGQPFRGLWGFYDSMNHLCMHVRRSKIPPIAA